MSHLQVVSVLLALLLAYGVVGRLDYEDAVAAEQRDGNLHLPCARDPRAPSVGRGTPPARGIGRPAAFPTGGDAAVPFWRDVLYCVDADES